MASYWREKDFGSLFNHWSELFRVSDSNPLIFNLMRLLFLSMSLLLCSSLLADIAVDQLSPVRQWIDRQSSVTSVEASFVQERHFKALKRPIIHAGKLWFKSPSLFRWQIGTPVESVAIKRRSELFLLRPQKMTGEHFTQSSDRLRRTAPGTLFFDLGFPRSHEDFTEKFTVTNVTLMDGSYYISVKVNDIRTSLALRKIVFEVDAKSFRTKGIVMRFRDSSSVNTRFSAVRENSSLDDSLFSFDITGYKIIRGD